MKYQIILKKTSVDLSTKEYSTLNLEWNFSDFREALQKYLDLVGDEANLIARIEFTRIVDEITLARVEEGKVSRINSIIVSN